jgi:hypothetical protein
MNVVKGTSADVCGVFSAFDEVFLSIATSVARRTVVHMMTGFGQDCIRLQGVRRVRKTDHCAWRHLFSELSPNKKLRIRSADFRIARLLARTRYRNFLL